MARARGDTPDDGGEKDIRQQKLPLSWRGEPLAAALPVTDESVEAGHAAAPPEPVAADVATAPAVAPAAGEPPPTSASPAAAPAPVVEAPAKRVVHLAHVAARRPAAGLTDNEPEPLPTAAPSGGVGDLLLSARADSGFSIEEASARTRIPRDIIEHLECNACGQLPSEYYCSAHIEKLSALYNVDPKPLLDRLHADLLAQRGEADGLGHFRAVTTDSESGSKISYVLPGPGSGKPTRAVSLTGAIVSGGIALLLVIVIAALAAQHFHQRAGDAPTRGVLPQVGHKPAVEIKEFIVTEELNAYELPVPAK